MASCSSSISRTRAERVTEILRFMCYPPSSAGSHTHCSGSLVKPVMALTVPFAFQSPCSCKPSMRANRRLLPFCVNDVGKIRGNHSLHAPTRANIPTSPYDSRRFRAKWNTRNWRTEAGISRSDTPQHRARRKLTGKRLSLHGRSSKRGAANRNQTNLFAAIAGAMTWLRVSSSGGIADAASVLVNAMDLWHLRGRPRSRNSSIQVVGRGPARKGSALLPS